MIFRSDYDRNNLLNRLSDLIPQTRTDCFAWALMPSHFHLLLRTGSVPIAVLMRRLLTGYAGWFNKKYKRHGHLFQNRYKSFLCQENIYLKELVRYIHLNPVRSRIVEDLKELDRHPWSGHSVLMNKKEQDWQNIEYVYGPFADPIKLAHKEQIGDRLNRSRKLSQIVKGRSFVGKSSFRICNSCLKEDTVGLEKCPCGGDLEPSELYRFIQM